MNPAGRDPRLDALRGLALLGILLINIESFLSGGPNPIGYLGPDAGSADRFAYFFVATFVVGKFMPLFGMLFGAGFSLLYDKLKSRFADPRPRVSTQARLSIGVRPAARIAAVLRRYHAGLRGRRFVLLRYADSDGARLARATRFWWFVAAGWLLFAIVPLSGTPDTAREIVETIETQSVATATLGYFAQWPLRAELFAWQLQANLHRAAAGHCVDADRSTGSSGGLAAGSDRASVAPGAPESAWASACRWRWSSPYGLCAMPTRYPIWRCQPGSSYVTRPASCCPSPTRRLCCSRRRERWSNGWRRRGGCRSRTTCCNRSRWVCC